VGGERQQQQGIKSVQEQTAGGGHVQPRATTAADVLSGGTFALMSSLPWVKESRQKWGGKHDKDWAQSGTMLQVQV
jgi:hypothetical protein